MPPNGRYYSNKYEKGGNSVSLEKTAKQMEATDSDWYR